MASSPTPSLDSIRCTNSVESFGDHNGYLSDSPLTLSRSSPPECDSALCGDFKTNSSATVSQHLPISASVSSSSSSSSSGLSGCGSTSSSNNSDVINGSCDNGSNLISSNGQEGGKNNLRCCTACKSTQLNAVAKCFDCVSFLCSNCVAAHEFMHCFNGHNVSVISEQISIDSTLLGLTTSNNEYKIPGSFASLVKHQSAIQQHKQMQLSQLSKIVMNSASASASASVSNGDGLVDAKGNGPISVSNCIDSLELDDHRDDLIDTTTSSLFARNPLICNRHKGELVKFNCRSCCTLACTECVLLDHTSGIHEIENIQDFSPKLPVSLKNGILTSTDQSSVVQSLISDLRAKLGDIANIVSNSDSCSSKIKMQYQKAHNEINETYQFFCSMLDERKQELLKELESLYNKKVTSNNNWLQSSKELMEKTIQNCETLERNPQATSVSELLMLRKTLEVQIQAIVQKLQSPFELEFSSNYQAIQNGVRSNFGSICTVKNDILSSLRPKQPPIARPVQQGGSSSGSSTSSLSGLCNNFTSGGLGITSSVLESTYGQGCYNSNLLSTLRNNGSNAFDDGISKSYQLQFDNLSGQPIGNSSSSCGFSSNPYEKWSNGCTENLFTNSSEPFNAHPVYNSLNNSIYNDSNNINSLNIISGSSSSDTLMNLTNKLLSVSLYPPKSQIKRQKMIYHCKFGEFGVMEGQFTEPSGVTVNAQNDIIVADTNNHRIQIFDKEGRFKFQFGECGKRDSQLLYPNRVAIVRSSGDIIVTERSPTHQIQVYNQYGQFVRKFGANILQHPRGVTVDNKGRIIVVECKVMRVIIFDQNGNVLHKFGCSKHLEFPNGVVVNDKQEIFISDNRAHCVKVFNYEGQYLRQIGGEGITNYPIGVGINSNGEILIADNHNNFNLTIFTQDGVLVSALESKVKHAQCFDVALMDDGSVVLASKDYRLYIYRYIQIPPIGI